jgi:heme exporter protein A
MHNAGLECENLSYSVSGLPLLHGISFILKPGQLMLLQGQNGSGKTTLLKLLARILKAEQGAVRWNGNAIASIPDYGRQMLYIGHGSAIPPALTPREVISFWARVYGTEELIEAALHYFELDRYAELPSRQLSAGWKQKLALTRLIISPAKLWLLDEPASHLDQEGSRLLQSLITTRKEQGGAILMAMHGEVNAENIKILNLDDLNQIVEADI